MRNIFKRQTTLISLLTILAGLILILYPGHTLNFLVSIVGWGCTISGISSLIGYFSGWRSPRVLTTAIGSLAVGLWILIMPSFFVSIIPFVVGLIMAINGGVNIRQALNGKKYGALRWKQSLFMAVIALLFGLLIMLNPFASVSSLVMIAGIGLVYNGITGLLIGAVV